jgi:hypothetical protein
VENMVFFCASTNFKMAIAHFSILVASAVLLVIICSCTETSTTEPKSQENNPPDVPSDPQPEDYEENVSIYTNLFWYCTDPEIDDLSYDVYLGTEIDPPKVVENIVGKAYEPETLMDDITYYWRIVAIDSHGGSTSGPIWRFHTLAEPGNNPPGIPFNPWPEDSAKNVFPSLWLNWSCVDPDGDMMTYHLLWGLSDNLQLIVNGVDTTAYFLYDLPLWWHVYWQVIAEDKHGAATAGPVWDFYTAIGSDNHPPDIPFSPSPPDSATDVNPAEVDLTWECTDPDEDEMTYDLYWGTTPYMMNWMFNLETPLYRLTDLQEKSRYYWQVIARDDHNAETKGPVWTFLTKELELEVFINNIFWVWYDGDGISEYNYNEARNESWINYINNSGYEHGGDYYGAPVGQSATVQYVYSFYSVVNLGVYSHGIYDLESKDNFSTASLRMSLGQIVTTPFVFNPFYIEFYIDDVKAGQYLCKEVPADTGYFADVIVPLDFNSVKTGSNIKVEFRSNRFKQINPAPMEIHSSNAYYLEMIHCGWPVIVLQ